MKRVYLGRISEFCYYFLFVFEILATFLFCTENQKTLKQFLKLSMNVGHNRLRLRSHRQRGPHWQDLPRLEPAEGLQAGIQALGGGTEFKE